VERLIKFNEHTQLAFAFVILNIGDIALTTIAWNMDKFNELNPLWSWSFQVLPLWSNWLLKIGIAVLCAGVILRFSHRYPNSTKRILTALIIAMGVVCLINAIAILI